jgi:hypothetical protein
MAVKAKTESDALRRGRAAFECAAWGDAFAALSAADQEERLAG